MDEIYTLKGNFDIELTPSCTLNCKGCTTTDYMNLGNTICNLTTFSEIEKIVDNLKKNKLKVDTLTFLGGEPTIHPEFLKFAEYLYNFKGVIYEKLVLHSNATNINEDFIKSLDFFDIIKFSFYPISKVLRNEIINSGLYKLMVSKKVKVWFKEQYTFLDYGKKDDRYEYTKELNWKRCHLRNTCRIITGNEIYRCAIAYNERKEGIDFSNKDEIIKYIENDTIPLNLCETCPFPPKSINWESNNPEKDKRITDLAVKKIRKLNLNKFERQII